MHNTEKIALIATGAAIMLTVKTRIDKSRDAKKRARTLAILREMDASIKAFEIMNERVLNGEYRGKTAEQIKTDFEFEQIAILEK